ncbi:MAG: hybrid sensor histidine kinase/response regulator [Chloroflexi bacterium]|nr:hybrid sensor histidine kinase/response regulator [Chloroflexota bacterium]
MQSELILVVEDNDEIRESISSILDVNGFEVLSASGAREAFDILEDQLEIPDLIISDIRMPGMDGYEFLDELREMDRYRNVPFVFLTALGEDHHRSLALEKGSDGYIVKPFQPESLVATIRNRINRIHQMEKFADAQLDRTRYVLLQVLSHELRTPLTYVMGGFALLKEEMEMTGSLEMERDADMVNHIFDVVESGTKRLFRVAEQTSMLAELMTGHAARHWEQISQVTSISSIVYNVVDALHSYTVNKGIDIKVVDDSDAAIYGVENMLSKAFFEVLHNAIHFSPKGSEVRVRYYTNNRKVITTVEDTGRGIKKEDQHKVFDMMHQSDREKYEDQGLGLGLTLTKGIIEAHNGKISLASEFGVGTTVTIELPIHGA